MSVTNQAATEHEIGTQQIIVEWVTELIQKFLLNLHKIETESHENNSNDNNNNNNKR